MEIKVLLCNCKGLSPTFWGADMNKFPFRVEAELKVKYAVLHPQLCGQGGNEVLAEVLRTASPDTYVVVGACAPDSQREFFKKVLHHTGFDERHFVPVDIRGTNNNGMLARLRTAIERILQQESASQRAGVSNTDGF
jgi:heterodisulfide reductase subunit A-like polyferredoxin